MTIAGFVLGTPDFLAPEVACGERATPASDSWQLAATISFALTGHPPRGGHTDAVSGLRAAATGAPLTPPAAALRAPRAAARGDGHRPGAATAAARRCSGALEDWLRRAGGPPGRPGRPPARRGR